MTRTRIEDLVFHGLAEDWTITDTGHIRYRARCSGCGWTADRYWATPTRVERDHKTHVDSLEATSS